MILDEPFQGGLFAGDFLKKSITELDEWNSLTDSDVDDHMSALQDLFAAFPTAQTPNEKHTEDDLIWKVLERLGWTEWLRQQNLSPKGHADIPDGLLFDSVASKVKAAKLQKDWARYKHGQVVVESKRWGCPLDKRTEGEGVVSAPSTQMLRYLRRIDDLTNGKLRWGILTNGGQWRLYHAGAQSVSEDFFEIDLQKILDVGSVNYGLFPLNQEDRRHWFRIFIVVFGRAAFQPGSVDQQTFHQRAINVSAFYEKRVASDLTRVVFENVFPRLVRAIAAEKPDAPLGDVRDAALVLLYRLLFILYAEDRNLLPVSDERYGRYSVRKLVREDVQNVMDEGGEFSETGAKYWSTIDDLCRAIDSGDHTLALPPYNGGLFDRDRTPLLADIRLVDAVIGKVVDAMGFEVDADGQRQYINYRDLGVQQLGSIYEGLLEREVVRNGDDVAVRANIFVRRESGSYYTPDDLVGLVIDKTVGPLVTERLETFAAAAEKETADVAALAAIDPAEKILELKVCDPAMGSGHFLVNLVDFLSDRVITAMAEAEARVEGYVSPLAERIAAIRGMILDNAEKGGWGIDPARLDDRHIVRRMVLKRCVYGVDMNPMAVELAKVALWLHTFTVGAPLSFLDHHLRYGNSLFGSWVRSGIDKGSEQGERSLMAESVKDAEAAGVEMQTIEMLTDAEVGEAHLSATTFTKVEAATEPLNAVLSLVHAFEWLGGGGDVDQHAVRDFLIGRWGDPIEIALGRAEPKTHADNTRPAELLREVRRISAEQGFFHWQVAFPGVWSNWNYEVPQGGFDAVIGNPPWDKMRFERIPWFASRRPEIAHADTQSKRNRMIAELEAAGDPLFDDYMAAQSMADAARWVAKNGGDYPFLGSGDQNLYSLFVERAISVIKPDGVIGLITPSGIATDRTTSPFFKCVATEGRLRILYDFENKRPGSGGRFFSDVDSRFKFCVFVAGRASRPDAAECTFFLRDISEIDDPERHFEMRAEDFASVNPNTGTAPVFRYRRDAELTRAIYGRLPVLMTRMGGQDAWMWPVKYVRMFDMAANSGQFRTREQLEETERAWPTHGGRFDSADGEWVPLYEGKMVQAFDHRAADVIINDDNLFRPGQQDHLEEDEKRNPGRLPIPRYYVPLDHVRHHPEMVGQMVAGWTIGFKDITAVTNARTMIATVMPAVGAGHTLPLLPIVDVEDGKRAHLASLIVANLNAAVFDYVARQKVPTTHFLKYVLEQLPVVPLNRYDELQIGSVTAGDLVREVVLELTYTAHDLADFAREMGHVDEQGNVRLPFIWDDDRRLQLRAKLDALYFHLYGVRNRDDVRYIYSTFKIVGAGERERWGSYRSLDLCLAWMNAIEAGEPNAKIDL